MEYRDSMIHTRSCLSRWTPPCVEADKQAASKQFTFHFIPYLLWSSTPRRQNSGISGISLHWSGAFACHGSAVAPMPERCSSALPSPNVQPPSYVMETDNVAEDAQHVCTMHPLTGFFLIRQYQYPCLVRCCLLLLSGGRKRRVCTGTSSFRCHFRTGINMHRHEWVEHDLEPRENRAWKLRQLYCMLFEAKKRPE